MHATTFIAAFLAASATALQVNWYNDHNCGSYKDTTYFSGRGIHGNEINGKPSSAGSALFVTQDGDCPVYGCSSPTGGCVRVNVGECVSYVKGTYVACVYNCELS